MESRYACRLLLDTQEGSTTSKNLQEFRTRRRHRSGDGPTRGPPDVLEYTAPLKDCTTLEQRAVIRFLNA
ncbi:hypothetical protein LAZ67_13002971 [Cordylochernes scorpioides]|uniref:Uncharacterized protein n=1 Tax=Cordylochernes scorpioides TaxID=51811 RepID=A0ABY6L7D9_9ARAC|nr:hypothetical protein LAZ67_13002971 [Cordylochernes scorpioides]